MVKAIIIFKESSWRLLENVTLDGLLSRSRRVPFDKLRATLTADRPGQLQEIIAARKHVIFPCLSDHTPLLIPIQPAFIWFTAHPLGER